MTYHQESIEIFTPHPGWVEQDANDILETTLRCMDKAVEQLPALGYAASDIKGSRQVTADTRKAMHRILSSTSHRRD